MTHLEHIMARTAVAVERRREAADLRALERAAAARRPRGFRRSLLAAGQQRPAVIAEMKRASPSRGVLRTEYAPAEIARSYEHSGAAALSVLTDEEFFLGRVEDMTEASGAVQVPVLRKDFMLEEFQVLEARAAGADAILLIVAGLTDERLRTLAKSARELELDVLCEVHDRTELRRAVDLGFETIGVNSRNLKTLEVNLGVLEELAASMPGGVLRVAESGIRSGADVAWLMGLGYGAFLIGEAFLREADPGAGLAALLADVPAAVR